jgi:hypothetical protein
MISHARRLPTHLVNASIPRLNFKSDCNESPSRLRLCRLDRTGQARRLIQHSLLFAAIAAVVSLCAFAVLTAPNVSAVAYPAVQA